MQTEQSLVRLSWSSFSAYSDCPKNYWFSQNFPAEAEVTDRQRYNYVFGNVMQDTFSYLYNSYCWEDRLWTKDLLMEAVKKEFSTYEEQVKYGKTDIEKETISGRFFASFRQKYKIRKTLELNLFDSKTLEFVLKSVFGFAHASLEEYTTGLTLGVKYKPKTVGDFWVEIKKSIQQTLKVVLREKLFGAFAQAEAKVSLNKYGIRWVAFLDFLVLKKGREQDEYVLLDGKSGESRDPDIKQLIFYMLILRLKFGEISIRPGFLFYREGIVKWVNIVKEDLDKMFVNLLAVRDKILGNEFPYGEKPDCFWCSYRAQCDYYKKKVHGHTDAEVKKLLEMDDSESFLPQ